MTTKFSYRSSGIDTVEVGHELSESCEWDIDEVAVVGEDEASNAVCPMSRCSSKSMNATSSDDATTAALSRAARLLGAVATDVARQAP